MPRTSRARLPRKRPCWPDTAFPTTADARRRPLIGMISRMVDQKGFDLIAALAAVLPRLDATFVVLGTGEAQYQDMWRRLAAAHPDRIGARIGFDEELAHLIEGGRGHVSHAVALRAVRPESDVQLALRHRPDRPRRRRPGRHGRHDETGFVFRDYSAAALLDAHPARGSAFADPPRWRALQARAWPKIIRGTVRRRSTSKYTTVFVGDDGRTSTADGLSGHVEADSLTLWRTKRIIIAGKAERL